MEDGVGLDFVKGIVRRIRDSGGDNDLSSASNSRSIFQMNAEMALAETNALRPAVGMFYMYMYR